MRRLVLAAVTAALLAFTPVANATPGSGHGSGGGGGGGGGGGTKSIVVSASQPSVETGENDWPSFDVFISRSGNLKCPTQVTYTFTNGEAENGSDFTGVSGSVQFTAGQVGATSVTVPILNDGVPEDTEDFTLTLGTASVPAGAKGCKGVTASVNPTAATTTVDINDSDVVFEVPAGQTLELSDMLLHSCNPVSAFYEVDGTPTEIVSYGGECEDLPFAPSDVTLLNDTAVTQIVRLGLTDDTCGRTYLSDTTSRTGATPGTVNHASVAESSAHSWYVDLADGVTGCNTYRAPPTFNGEFSAQVRIEPPTTSGTFEIPVGQQAIIDVTVAGCDSLVAYYETASGLQQIVGNGSGFCPDPATNSATVVNSSESDPLPFTIVLEDQNCLDGNNDNVLYASDGTGTADHATAWATNPVSVDIADAGGGCSPRWDQPFDTDFDDGNLHATVTFEPIPT
jgi:hypothetical protein